MRSPWVSYSRWRAVVRLTAAAGVPAMVTLDAVLADHASVRAGSPGGALSTSPGLGPGGIGLKDLLFGMLAWWWAPVTQNAPC
ncbi:MAG: hypothetical protein IPK24_22755 [Kineosporiaceae bacterium]|nr:hypothetical protein [Kineosporiaceae bacterium]